MAQPLDRERYIEAQGAVDTERGEFWVENPFLIAKMGHNLSAFERNRLYLNDDGGESFLDVSFASGADIDSDSRSAIPCDFDRDGAVDLLVVSVGGGPLRLFRNRFPDASHRIRLELRGKTSNATAIGARVIAHVGSRQIVRDLFPANGFGMAPAELLIGLGDAERIDTLRVRWPSGEEQDFSNLPVDRRVLIVEGRDQFQSLPFLGTVRKQ